MVNSINLKKMSFFVVRKLVKNIVKLEVLLTSTICCVILDTVRFTKQRSTKKGEGYYVNRSDL